MTLKINDNLNEQLYATIANYHAKNPFAQLLGIKLMALGDGQSRFIFRGRHEHTNPLSSIHGGVTATLGDVAMAAALRTKGIQVVTAELTVNYISLGKTNADLEITGRAVHMGKSVCLAEFSIHDLEKNHLVATGKGIFVSRGSVLTNNENQ